MQVTRLDEGDLTAVSDAYDVIVCEGAVSSVPAAWCEQIRLGGRLGVVVRRGPVGRAELYLRSERDVGRRDLFDCAPPIMAGFEAEAGVHVLDGPWFACPRYRPRHRKRDNRGDRGDTRSERVTLLERRLHAGAARRPRPPVLSMDRSALLRDLRG